MSGVLRWETAQLLRDSVDLYKGTQCDHNKKKRVSNNKHLHQLFTDY